MGLVIAVSRFVLPFVAVVVIAKCMLSLILGHPKDKVYGCLIDKSEHKKYAITTLESSVGRSNAQDIKLANKTVSRNHAVISRRLDNWHIYDLNSSWGIVVNKEKVKGSAVIKDGDIITLGTSNFIFSVLDDPVTVVGGKRKKTTSDKKHTEDKRGTLYDLFKYDKKPAPDDFAKRYNKRCTLKNCNSGTLYELSGDHVSIGRGTTNDIKLVSPIASRHHADILLYENGWAISDAGSRNGTLLNGKPISRAQILFDGDIVAFGSEKFLFNETIR